MASLGNFYVRQSQMLVGTKNFPSFSCNKIQYNSVFSDIHNKVQKYFFTLLYVVHHKAILIFSETESFLILHAISPLLRLQCIVYTFDFSHVRWPMPNAFIPHINHYFCCTSYFVLIHKFKCRDIFCRLAHFPALRRARTISDWKMIRVLHLVILRCEQW